MQCFTDSGKLTMSRRSKHACQEHEQPKKVYRAMVSAIARRDDHAYVRLRTWLLRIAVILVLTMVTVGGREALKAPV